MINESDMAKMVILRDVSSAKKTQSKVKGGTGRSREESVMVKVGGREDNDL